MKPILAIPLLAVTLASLSCGGNATAFRSAATLTDDEKHRLYTAALAASETPLESELFKQVCRKIGIFDAEGKPNHNYMAFVAQHIDWAMRPENGLFRREIDTKEEAIAYLNKHSP